MKDKEKIVLELTTDFDISDVMGYSIIDIVCDDYRVLWVPLLDMRSAMPKSKIFLTKHGLDDIITTVLMLEKLNGLTLIIDKEGEMKKLKELDNFLTLYEPDRWELYVKADTAFKPTRFKRFSFL